MYLRQKRKKYNHFECKWCNRQKWCKLQHTVRLSYPMLQHFGTWKQNAVLKKLLMVISICAWIQNVLVRTTWHGVRANQWHHMEWLVSIHIRRVFRCVAVSRMSVVLVRQPWPLMWALESRRYVIALGTCIRPNVLNWPTAMPAYDSTDRPMCVRCPYFRLQYRLSATTFQVHAADVHLQCIEAAKFVLHAPPVNHLDE